jgi:RES domain-containing protein
MLANLTSELPYDYVAVPVEIPDGLPVKVLLESDLPPNWWASGPRPVEIQNIGTAWARDLQTAVLSVPSAVIRQERNYILNPAHPDFRRIAFGSPEAFLWDERLRVGR